MRKNLGVGIVLILTLVACSSDSKSPTNSSSSSYSSSHSSAVSSSRNGESSSAGSRSSQGDTSPRTAQCLATDFQQASEISMQELIPGGQFEQPTGLVFKPGNDDVMYVLEQDGLISRVEREGDALAYREFIDLSAYYNVVVTPETAGSSCHECGLYSMTFHPDFDDNGYIYTSFTTGGADGAPLESHIVRFRSDDDGVSLVESGGLLESKEIYHVDQPTLIHNNGQVKFGPDGYLYVSFGDGGRADWAQDTSKPFGSILRLTDDGEPAPGNLVGGLLPEIYAYGLRNPWHWSIDRLTGELWAGDVGQASVEEVDIIVNGGNYGWPCFEGFSTYWENCGSDGPFEDPVWDYSHVDGRSVTGGYVYRGSALPELYGVYLFSDFAGGVVWGLEQDGDGNYSRSQLLASGQRVVAFSEDNQGELYILDYVTGAIYKLVEAEEDPERQPLPGLLSDTGCVDPDYPLAPAEHLIPYEINEPFWSDNSEKERFIALPEDTRITIDNADGNFEFPVGTILVKNFSLVGSLIETRLLLLQETTGWSGFSYKWLPDGSDAVLLEGSLERGVAGQVWHYPSGAECSSCHTPAAGYALGLEAAQLNKDIVNPATGVIENQLDMLADQDFIWGSIRNNIREMVLPDSKDTSHSLDDRAHSFLHSNCSNCHRPGGTTQATLDFRFDTGPSLMNLCNKEPMQSDLGIPNARLMTPGNPEQSILWQRLVSEDEHRMPPIGSNVIDQESADLIYDWIASMDACQTVVGTADGSFNIKNRFTDEYLQVSGGTPVLADLNNESLLGTWTVEPIEGSFRLGNQGVRNGYLHIETGPLEVSAAPEGWWSARWEFVPADDTGTYFRIRSRWQDSNYLHTEGGGLNFGEIQSDWHSAMWLFEEIKDE